MANYSTFTNSADKVLLWSHGRRLGVKGDGQGPAPVSTIVLDGVAVGSTRSGPNSVKAVAAGSNGKGAVTVAGAVVGDRARGLRDSAFTRADASNSGDNSMIDRDFDSFAQACINLYPEKNPQDAAAP